MKRRLLSYAMCAFMGHGIATAQSTNSVDTEPQVHDQDKKTSLRVMTPDGEWVHVEHHSSDGTRRAVAETLCESRKGFQVPHILKVSYIDENGEEVVLECPPPE